MQDEIDLTRKPENEMPKYLTPVAAARKLGVTYCTLNSWRAKGCPHMTTSIGIRTKALYNLDDVMAWMEKRRLGAQTVKGA